MTKKIFLMIMFCRLLFCIEKSKNKIEIAHRGNYNSEPTWISRKKYAEKIIKYFIP